MSFVDIRVVGQPAPQGSKRGFVNKHSGKVSMVESSSERVKSWRSDVRDAAFETMAKAGAKVWACPVKVSIVFYLPRPKGHYGTGRNAEVLKLSSPLYPAGMPDLDKLARSTLDALTGVVFVDDAQVVELEAHKTWAGGIFAPGASIIVEALHLYAAGAERSLPAESEPA